MLDVTKPRKLLSGGGGMVSTTMDYARFAQMLLSGDKIDGVRLLGPRTVAYMASDHLGKIPGYVRPGYSFGLGFGVRMTPGVSYTAGSVGDYHWQGLGGSAFWVDPKEDMFVVFMLNDMIIGPGQYHHFLIRDLVYQALIK